MGTKHITIMNGNDKALTFYERLAVLRATTTEAHYNAALLARAEFEEFIVQAVSSRVMQVANAIVAD